MASLALVFQGDFYVTPIANRAKTVAGAAVTVATAITSTAVKSAGLARTPKGSYYIVAQGAGEVPRTAIKQCGWAFTPKGALYTTDTAPSSTAVWRNGIAVRRDGAVHVTTTIGVTNASGFSITNGRLGIV